MNQESVESWNALNPLDSDQKCLLEMFADEHPLGTEISQTHNEVGLLCSSAKSQIHINSQPEQAQIIGFVCSAAIVFQVSILPN